MMHLNILLGSERESERRHHASVDGTQPAAGRHERRLEHQRRRPRGREGGRDIIGAANVRFTSCDILKTLVGLDSSRVVNKCLSVVTATTSAQNKRQSLYLAPAARQ